jgi:hypothetical protein
MADICFGEICEGGESGKQIRSNGEINIHKKTSLRRIKNIWRKHIRSK